jgi:hypothetical protein
VFTHLQLLLRSLHQSLMESIAPLSTICSIGPLSTICSRASFGYRVPIGFTTNRAGSAAAAASAYPSTCLLVIIEEPSNAVAIMSRNSVGIARVAVIGRNWPYRDPPPPKSAVG